jgi:hypothetical protein
MNTLGSVDEQVARLEALLKRVQVNAMALRNERASGEALAAPLSLTPSSAAPTSAIPGTAPTGTVPPRPELGTLPDFLERSGALPDATADLDEIELDSTALDREEPVTEVPAAPGEFEPVPVMVAPGAEAPVSLDSLESDLPTLPPSRDDEFQDPSTEHTKPLWLGLNQETGTFRSEGADMERPGDSHRTLAETPAAKVYDTAVGFGTYDASAEAPIVDAPYVADSLGTVAHGDADIASFDGSMAEVDPGEAVDPGEVVGSGEEEHLDTSPPISGHRASTRSPDISVAAESLTPEDLEQELEVSSALVDDSGGRISDAPPSVLGATITLPEESSDVALELLEPPLSSFRPPATSDDGLEAELPRTSFRAEYDASLSAPPSAAEDLRAHDAGQERKALEQRTSRSPERVAVGQVADDDLPPVLSSRPAAPSGVGSVMYTPEAGVVPATFEGSRPALRGLAFLELLDASLAIEAR